MRAEEMLAKQLRLEGFHVTRSSGSRGVFDLVATSSSEVRLISVKATICKDRAFTKKEVSKVKALKVPAFACITKRICTRLDTGEWLEKIIP